MEVTPFNTPPGPRLAAQVTAVTEGASGWVIKQLPSGDGDKKKSSHVEHNFHIQQAVFSLLNEELKHKTL